MKSKSLRLLLFAFFLAGHCLEAQVNDCSGAGIICDDGPVTSNSQGPGTNDFASANNDNGCLQAGEHQSSWYYFEFMPNMPVNSTIEFTISPIGGSGEDFDFAIYGPFVGCDSLGTPLRCSYASPNCAFCPMTGLGNNANDTSEGAAGDGFLAPLTVQPGQGFFLLVDNWLDSSNGFNLSWGGEAAGYLNCNANPDCAIEVNAGETINTCVNPDPIQLNGVASNTEGQVVYTWVADNPDHLAFLSQTNVPNPIVNLPNGFIDTITYTLTVADNLCISFDQMNIIVSNQFAPDIQEPELFCENWTYQLDAGEGFESYLWSTGATTATIQVSEPGTYTVTVTNPGGCASVDSVVLENPESAPLQPNIVGDTLLCIDSSIPLWAGAGYASYQWAHGPINPGVLITEPGTYYVTVTNETGCQASDSIVIAGVNAIATPVDLGSTADLCFNQTMVLDPGSEFITYEWSTFSANQTITVDTTGLYCVTVTDVNGCKSSDCVVVNQVENEALYITGYPYFCQSGTELSISTENDAYLWSTGSTERTVFIDEPGLYSVTVTNDECQDTLQVNVYNNTAIPPEIDGALFLCSGEPTLLTAQEGYTSYTWSDGSTETSLNITESGQYALSVTDQEGCEATVNFEVTESLPPVPEVIGDLGFCLGDTTWLEAEPGYASYQWEGLPTDSTTLMVTSEGSYSLTVVDNAGCTGSTTVEVIEFPALIPEIQGQDFFCTGEFVILRIDENYSSYEWSDGSEGNELTVSTPGIYAVTVVDAEGCVGENEIEIAELPLPEVTISGPSTLCPGSSVVLEAPAGFAAYSWSTGDSTRTITVTEPGIYVVEVTNNNGCSDKAVAGVQVLDSLTPEITGATGICGSGSTVLGLSGEYESYLWSDGSTTSSIAVSNAGWVSVTVTDVNGCNGEASVEIQETQGSFVVDAGEDQRINCDQPYVFLDGTASTMGTEFIYTWTTDDGHILSNPNQPMVQVDAGGTYMLMMTDTVYGCSQVDEVFVSEDFEFPEVYAGPDQAFHCNLEALTLHATFPVDGMLVAMQWMEVNSGEILGYSPSLEVNQPGTYIFELTNLENGCSSLDEVVISQLIPPSGFDLELRPPTCAHARDGSILINGVIGGVPPFQYSLDGAEYASNISFFDLQAGNYNLAVKDAHGCEFSQLTTLTPGNDLELDIGEDHYIHFGESVVLEALVNIPKAEVNSIQWEASEYLPCDSCWIIEVSPERSTVYRATLTDRNGCTIEDQVHVFVERPRDYYIPNAFSPDNDGHNDGFTVYSGQDVSNIKSIQIFNRWGGIVFQATDLPPNDETVGWNGKRKNIPNNSGVYIYIVELEFTDGESIIKKGDVTLIR